MSVTSLVTSIKARQASVLGATYSEIGFIYEIEKNPFKGNAKRYGVFPSSASEVQGNTRAVTVDQVFEMVITDGFINTAMSDSLEQTLKQTLQDLSFSIYQDLAQTKCGANSSVLLVSNFELLEPQTIENNVAVQRSRFTIKYRL